MKFGILALDYDGTIARDGVLDPDVKSAIAEARMRGIVVVLVTGRNLSDLKRLAGGIEFVDAVVAENGAVLALPNGHTRLFGNPPPQAFLAELHRRGIQFATGECVVEADASSAQQILTVIRDLELPLVVLFNRCRLMILPQAISKGTGFRELLKILRLSPHNSIAIGDAENDHELLAACEVAVAVGWGTVALQRQADEVLRGDGPRAVAAYIRQVAKSTRLPHDKTGRHRIALGIADDGCPVTTSIPGRNILIVGDPNTGKSWANGLLCEQMILQGYCVCIVDPEGDYSVLESLPGVLVLGGDDPPPDLPHVARAMRHFDLSVVIDLSHQAYNQKVRYLNALLPMLASLRRSTGLPHRIVVDEAHYFLQEPNVKELLDFEQGSYTIITYRPSDLHPDLRQKVEYIIAKRLTSPNEVQTLLSIAGLKQTKQNWSATLAALARDEAALVVGTEEAGAQLRRFKLLPRLTPHVRHKTKYFDVQVSADEGFFFTDCGGTIDSPARSLQQFVSSLADKPMSCLDGHVRRGDFSQWIAGVFHDYHLASDVLKVEQRYRLDHLQDVRQPIATLIQQRYSFSNEEALKAHA
jgi:hydroxymethylpyrimidine pyrophosphatase-like HAD family hydrolase